MLWTPQKKKQSKQSKHKKEKKKRKHYSGEQQKSNATHKTCDTYGLIPEWNYVVLFVIRVSTFRKLGVWLFDNDCIFICHICPFLVCHTSSCTHSGMPPTWYHCQHVHVQTQPKHAVPGTLGLTANHSASPLCKSQSRDNSSGYSLSFSALLYRRTLETTHCVVLSHSVTLNPTSFLKVGQYKTSDSLQPRQRHGQRRQGGRRMYGQMMMWRIIQLKQFNVTGAAVRHSMIILYRERRTDGNHCSLFQFCSLCNILFIFWEKILFFYELTLINNRLKREEKEKSFRRMQTSMLKLNNKRGGIKHRHEPDNLMVVSCGACEATCKQMHTGGWGFAVCTADGGRSNPHRINIE